MQLGRLPGIEAGKQRLFRHRVRAEAQQVGRLNPLRKTGLRVDGQPDGVLQQIEKLVDEIIGQNPDKVEQAKAKPTVIGWFVGQVMKASGGKANPQAVNALLKSKLGI